MQLGGDGVCFVRRLQITRGTPLTVYIQLVVHEATHLIAIPGVVYATTPDGTDIRWTDISSDQRDLVIAYVFQQQAKERRRLLDAS